MRESMLTGGARRGLAVAGAVSGVFLVGAGVASAEAPVQLRSRLGEWCLDSPNGNNAATVVSPCNGSETQQWNFNAAGQIESLANPGDCLSISNASDNTPVMLSPCRPDADTTRWNAQPNGQITSTLGPCLNVFGGVAQPGTAVIAYRCLADVADEQWDSVQ